MYNIFDTDIYMIFILHVISEDLTILDFLINQKDPSQRNGKWKYELLLF